MYAGSAFKAFVVMAPPQDFVAIAQRIGSRGRHLAAARQYIQCVTDAIAHIEKEERLRMCHSSASNNSVEM